MRLKSKDNTLIPAKTHSFRKFMGPLDTFFFEGGLVDPTILRSACLVLTFGIFPWLIFALFPNVNTCAEDASLNYLWPQNFEFTKQLFVNGVARQDACLFLNMNSVMSAFFFIWLIWRVCFSIISKNPKFSITLLITSLCFLIVCLVASVAKFRPGSSPFDPSYDASFETNTIKNILIILGVYVSIGEVLSCAISITRRVHFNLAAVK